MAVFAHFKRPPHAKSFFIGDSIGGSGWEVETEEGATERFYVQLPPEIPGLKVHMNIYLSDAPEEFRSLPISSLCETFLERLSLLLKEARMRYVKST
jgi:hypothetical protein